MNDDTAELIPFHALNEFMREDYRLHVIRTVLSARPNLPDHLGKPIDQLTKKFVKVPGFRNAERAPARVRAAPTAEAFEKHPEMVAAILAAWGEVNSVLRRQVYDLLSARGWNLLPLDAQRARLPGFFIRWPKSEEFEALHAAFNEMYPEAGASPDDISLMVVWVSCRLPYQIIEESPESVTGLGADKGEAENGE